MEILNFFGIQNGIADIIFKECVGEYIFICTRYYPLGDINRFLTFKYGGTNNEIFISKVAYQLISSILVIHKTSCIHHCISPDLVYIDNNGNLLLYCFFPFSLKEKYSLFLNNKFEYNTRYISPKIIQNHSKKDFSIDLWSICIILLELCFGRENLNNLDIVTLNTIKVQNLFSNSLYSSKCQNFIIECITMEYNSIHDIIELLNNPFLCTYQHFNFSIT